MRCTGNEIKVTVELRSGAVLDFEISEPMFEYLKSLQDEGLRGWDLCREWLDGAISADVPVRIRVIRHFAGKPASPLTIECECRSSDAPRGGYRSGPQP